MSKASKADYSRINLLDTLEVIQAKVAKAETDSILEVYSAKDRPELTNLMQMYGALKGNSLAEVSQEFKGSTVTHFKAALTCLVDSQLAPIRDAVSLMLADPHDLKSGLERSRDRSRAVASQTLNEIKRAVGLVT